MGVSVGLYLIEDSVVSFGCQLYAVLELPLAAGERDTHTMTTNEIPPMGPLAPLIDQMREIAREELPEPRSCRVQLWDDGTFDINIYHSKGSDKREWITYERSTSEIVYLSVDGTGWETESFATETLHTPTYDESEARVITTVEPPYK